jgi:heptosyltransferase-1
MKIAIVKLSALGDIVHAMVALQFIKAYDPSIQIDWIVEQRFAGILEHNPDLNQIIPLQLKVLRHQKTLIGSVFRQIRALATHDYDLVIDAQGLIKSAITARLISKNVVGFDRNSVREKLATWFYASKLHCPYHENTIDRNTKILSAPLGFLISSEQILNKQPYLFFQSTAMIDELLASYPLKLIFVISSSWPTRNYPPEQFIAIAEHLKIHGLVIWGNAIEKQIADKMAEQSKWIRVLPKLDLNQLKQLMANANLIIGNDTGPTHIAWALNKPSIILFGCTPVNRVYQTPINRVLKSPSIVNPYKLNRHDDSVKQIPVSTVIELAQELINNTTNKSQNLFYP